jgi:hypothetical protein
MPMPRGKVGEQYWCGQAVYQCLDTNGSGSPAISPSLLLSILDRVGTVEGTTRRAERRGAVQPHINDNKQPK